mmetsp:Transcript_87065/g.130548  ORF Transcript_87065/g.130548 Transcript_87065/m.130548 type:complete len:112 (-) Transcript_87065:377-712(-)|eukprot:CAMPEP_0117027314 /NCGR_PEP_ID=MMETSP0472-20121206/19978_1 /TAXON_ID=693140 ORGANISM="Tiarina fusus, Strain LIS" /NCGR_SAMPLE_ID=MMETSP0472 /ASSEMBLY_ACC=CAM_ASM_000603 /LENGTH=111 /DNA_ID=CAMNT_0004734527 /DNA_START=95 /DNA_END=430 /DNA_ORIENTATION=+
MSRSNFPVRTTNETTPRDLARKLHKMKRRMLLSHVEQQEKALARVAEAQNSSDNTTQDRHNNLRTQRRSSLCNKNIVGSAALNVSATSRSWRNTRARNGSSSASAASARRE